MWGLLRVCEACPTPHLNWSLSSVPIGTTSMIRSPLGLLRIQQNSLVSDARLRQEERAPTRRAGESSKIWETIRFLEWTNTAGPAFEREQRPPVQGLREQTPSVQRSRESTARQFKVRGSRHRQFRVREREPTTGLRCTPAEAAALVHRCG
jgi:hypothetical protein